MAKTKTETKNSKTEKTDKPKFSVSKKTKKNDIEEIVVKLAKQGMTSEKIGLVLRDTYGISKTKLKLSEKKISQILKENNLYEDADLKNLDKKIESIKKHLTKNKQDKRTRRALTILNARLKKLKKYKKRKN